MVRSSFFTKSGNSVQPCCDSQAISDISAQTSNEDKRKRIKLKDRCFSVLNSRTVTTTMTFATVYAVYGEDTKILAFDESSDHVFVALSSTCFFLFLIEMLLLCWCRDNYFKIGEYCRRHHDSNGTMSIRMNDWTTKRKRIFSVLFIGSSYFWLDLLATVSMLLELSWLSSYTSSFTNSMGNARVGRISSVGVKATRILRLVRMIRLVRLIELYKYISLPDWNKRKSAIVPEISSIDDQTAQSHVGAKMSDRTTKKVIIGILFMLIVLPILQVDDMGYENEFGLRMVLDRRETIDVENSRTVDYWLNAENYFLNSTNCITLKYDGFHDGQLNYATIPTDRRSPSSIRMEDKIVYNISSVDNPMLSIEAIFDIYKERSKMAQLNVILTTFVILLLVIGAMTFSRDVNKLVIIPIEKMVGMVREISLNPLGKASFRIPAELKGMDDGLETTVLLRTIAKIARLMRLGFGEAGAEIICRNLDMSNYNGGSSAVTLLGSGSKIQSVFGFCDIRNFTDTTECLQEEVMLFVNRIAHILHSIVAQCDGAANKNIGDAFLMTWKLSEDKLGSCEEHGYAGDKALYSFLKTMVEITRNEDFIFNFSPTALGDLYERMPGYKCRLGCGLHFGWAIEGAIGSDKKIDVSYISPHVNWAEFLESSTKVYGVPILLSEPFVNLLSPQVSKYCRQVDRIKKNSQHQPISLYTYETFLDNLILADNNSSNVSVNRVRQSQRESKLSSQLLYKYSSRGSIKNRRLSYLHVNVADQNMVGADCTLCTRNHPSLHLTFEFFFLFKKKFLMTSAFSRHDHDEKTPEIMIPKFNVGLWESDDDMVSLRMLFSDTCRYAWNEGMRSYLDGNWSTALTYFDQVLLETNGTDGPALFLKRVITSNDSKAPHDWSGYRLLED